MKIKQTINKLTDSETKEEMEDLKENVGWLRQLKLKLNESTQQEEEPQIRARTVQATTQPTDDLLLQQSVSREQDEKVREHFKEQIAKTSIIRRSHLKISYQRWKIHQIYQ